MWFDSHCHLDMLGDPAGALARARSGGVTAMVTVGTDLDSSRKAAGRVDEAGGIWATAGIHPHDASSLDGSALAELERLAGVPGVVAIGETGLDYYRDLSPRPVQREAFEAQIDLAVRMDKALVVHVRDAFPDAFAVMESAELPRCIVLHCFTGGPEQARRAMGLGAFISFAGNISYKGSEEMCEAARSLPLDRILVETDSPFLTPVPHRGKAKNEPAYVAIVGEALAAAIGKPIEVVADATFENAQKAFGVKTG
jgi:TatD DNase family protein